jgi:hypothetical protein
MRHVFAVSVRRVRDTSWYATDVRSMNSAHRTPACSLYWFSYVIVPRPPSKSRTSNSGCCPTQQLGFPWALPVQCLCKSVASEIMTSACEAVSLKRWMGTKFLIYIRPDFGNIPSVTHFGRQLPVQFGFFFGGGGARSTQHGRPLPPLYRRQTGQLSMLLLPRPPGPTHTKTDRLVFRNVTRHISGL